MTSCIHLAGEAPLTHGYPTLLHWCCDAAPIKSTLASGYLAEGCFLTEFTVVPGKIYENLLDFTRGRCYSIRMYHNVSDVYIIYTNNLKYGSCYFSRQPILRRIYQTGMRWSRLWERHGKTYVFQGLHPRFIRCWLSPIAFQDIRGQSWDIMGM